MELNEKSKITLNKNKTYYFSGIGGIHMYALANILIDKGYTIAGSDINKTELTEEFRQKGYQINYSQKKENIKDNYVIVKNHAIGKDNEEYIKAVELGLEIIPKPLLLTHISTTAKVNIGISGTHGKTTTTTLLSHILIEMGYDPTCIVGGVVPEWNSSLRQGQNEIIVYEACEAFNNFRYYKPDYLIITSIDVDHLDHLKNFENIKVYFRKFIEKVSEKNKVILNLDDETIFDMHTSFNDKVYYYSAKDINLDTMHSERILVSSDYKKTEVITDNKNGENESFIELQTIDGDTKKIKFPLLGLHNVQNLLGAISVAYLLYQDKSLKLSNEKKGGFLENISNIFENFSNAKRRFEYVGEFQGAKIYNDYSHHPKEIESMLNTAKIATNESQKIIVVFQPHLYSRTRDFYVDFAKSLFKADNIILVPIYPAREKPIEGVSSKLIADELAKLGKKCYNVEHWEEAKEFLQRLASKQDIILTVGAGSVGNFHKELI